EPRGVDDVLEPDRHAVDGAVEAPLARVGVEPAGGREGSLAVDRHPGLDVRLAGVDASETGLDEIRGREPAGANVRGRVQDGPLEVRRHSAESATRKNPGSVPSGTSAAATRASSRASASMSRARVAARSAPNRRVASAVSMSRI